MIHKHIIGTDFKIPKKHFRRLYILNVHNLCLTIYPLANRSLRFVQDIKGKPIGTDEQAVHAWIEESINHLRAVCKKS